MTIYLPAVYAGQDGFGLALATVGFILLLSRVGDIMTDLLIGYMSDRTRTLRRAVLCDVGTVQRTSLGL